MPRTTLPLGRAGTPCDQAARMTPPAPSAPVIKLLPSNATVYIAYGRPSPVPLKPCAALPLGANGICGAVAWDPPVAAGADNATAAAAAANGTNATDLSAGVVVRDVTPCEKGQVGAGRGAGKQGKRSTAFTRIRCAGAARSRPATAGTTGSVPAARAGGALH